MDAMDHSMHNHSHHHHMHDAVTSAPDVTSHDHHEHMHHDHDAMDHSQHGENSDHSAHSGHMMMMYFHFSTSATILFEKWTTDNWYEMLLSCIAIFIMASMYEGLKVAREALLRHSQVSVKYNMQQVPTEDTNIVPRPNIKSSLLSLSHALQSLLHVVQVVISYFLMLIFMTYNVYLCLAVALGAGCGYFLFAWRRTTVVDVNEHCH